MKVALRRNKGILEFLGFVDGKGRIRKGKVRKVNVSIRKAFKDADPRGLFKKAKVKKWARGTKKVRKGFKKYGRLYM